MSALNLKNQAHLHNRGKVLDPFTKFFVVSALFLCCVWIAGCVGTSVPVGKSVHATQISAYRDHARAESESAKVSSTGTERPAKVKAISAVIPPPVSYRFAPVRATQLSSPSPRAFNTEVYDRVERKGFLEVVKNPLSTFSVDVDTASYTNVRRFLASGILPPPDAVRIEEMLNYFSYDLPQPQGDAPFSFTTELTDAPWHAGNKLLLVGLQARKVPTEQLPPANLVFLIDVSGSMVDEDKLPLLVKSFKMLTRELRPQDRVAIVTYAGNAGLALPSVSGAEREKIDAVLDSLEADGATDGGEGIVLAYRIARENFVKGGNNRVILATDGDFNFGVSSDGELERLIEEKRKEGIFLSVLGVGTGNYKDSRMQKLADRGNGNYAYLDNLWEAKKVLVRQFGGTLLTIAKDVKLQVEFNPAHVKSYRLIGYEKRQMLNEDFADDAKDAGELGSGHAMIALYEIVPADAAGSKKEDLTYQTTQVKGEAYRRDELGVIRFRYKKPDGDQSQELSELIRADAVPLDQASNNIRFAAAVAEWGMLMGGDELKGSASARQVVDLARAARGADAHGDRGEFVRLVETSELLGKN